MFVESACTGIIVIEHQPVCLQACLCSCVIPGMQDSGRLQDGAHQKPSYSLRTLCRALEYCRTALPLYGMQRALLDGLKMAFMTQLDPECAHIIRNLINVHVTGSAKPLKVWVAISADKLHAPVVPLWTYLISVVAVSSCKT